MVSFPSLRKKVEKQLSEIEKFGYQFQKKIDLATRQEFQIEYNSVIKNPGLAPEYRIEYADDSFDVIAAPWLRSMDSHFGERVCRCITMINSGWNRYLAQKKAFGGTVALCEVWEVYVVGDKLEEKPFRRELDAQSALTSAKVLKRLDKVTPKAEILEVYELPSLGRLSEQSLGLKQKLLWSQNYIANTEIIPCYRYANRVAWGEKDVGTDSPIVIQNSAPQFGGSGAGSGGLDPELKAALLKASQGGEEAS
jgi:hypothetical protein